MKSPTTPKGRHLARQRGRRFEYRVASKLEELGAYIYTGTNGDVATDDYIVECKYRGELHGLGEFPSFLEQAKRNADWWAKQGKSKKWLLFITGGRRTGSTVTMDADDFLALWREAHEHPRSN